MNLRKNMVLVVGGSVALALFIVVMVALLKFQRDYLRVNTSLQGALQRLNALYTRDPYPSSENVVQLATNLTVLQAYFTDLFSSLKKNQIEPAQMERAEFPLLLQQTRNRLLSRAAETGVVLPDKFSFGFDRYARGELPEQGDVARLVLQVKTLEDLCGVLFQSKIASIVSLQRTVFEQKALESEGPGAMGRGSRRGFEPLPDQPAGAAPVVESVDSSGLFSKEHYILTFEAKDPAIWQVLDLLARSKRFNVVTRVELLNDKPLPTAAAPAAGAPSGLVSTPGAQPTITAPPSSLAGGAATGPKTVALTHDERIVAGRDAVRATVELDVYRFLGDQPKQEGGP